MSADRSSLLCLKALDGRYCTLRVGHESARLDATPCEHLVHFHGGEWVEACQVCGGPLGTVLRADREDRLRCGECWREWNDARWDAELAQLVARGELQRRAELRRKARQPK